MFSAVRSSVFGATIVLAATAVLSTPVTSCCQVLFSSDGSDLSLFPCFYLTWTGPDPVIDPSIGNPQPSIRFNTWSPATYAMSEPYTLPTLAPGYLFRGSQDFRIDGTTNYICVACFGISTHTACDYHEYNGPIDGEYPFPSIAYNENYGMLDGYYFNADGNIEHIQEPYYIEKGVWHHVEFVMTQNVDGVFEWSLSIDEDIPLSGYSYGEVTDNDLLGIIIGAAGSSHATDARVDNVVVELSLLCDYGPPELPVFIRQSGKPTVETVTWESCGGPGFLRATSDHLSSAYVLVNGAMLLSPSDFNPGVGEFEVPVTLVEGTNTLEVELRGKPGSSMSIDFVPVE